MQVRFDAVPKVHNLRFEQAVVLEMQKADCDRQLEAVWPAGAWIEVEHSLMAPDCRLVRMAIEYSGELGCGRVKMERTDIVEKVDVTSLDKQDFRFRQARARTRLIDVATYRGYGSDFAEGIENFRVSNVAEVQDCLDSFQRREDFGAQEAVRIADNANLHL